MEVLQVMAECQLRAGMTSLMVRVRPQPEAWVPFRLLRDPSLEGRAASSDASEQEIYKARIEEPMVNTKRSSLPDGAETPLQGAHTRKLFLPTNRFLSSPPFLLFFPLCLLWLFFFPKHLIFFCFISHTNS